jgi:hypothetical protein
MTLQQAFAASSCATRANCARSCDEANKMFGKPLLSAPLS